jgi:hypothetical protein
MDVTYKATNAFGWPQVVISVYGVDALGRDVIQGYGCIHLPTCAGRWVRIQDSSRRMMGCAGWCLTRWMVGNCMHLRSAYCVLACTYAGNCKAVGYNHIACRAGGLVYQLCLRLIRRSSEAVAACMC